MLGSGGFKVESRVAEPAAAGHMGRTSSAFGLPPTFFATRYMSLLILRAMVTFALFARPVSWQSLCGVTQFS